MVEGIRGRNVVAVIDFHETIIYPTDAAPGDRPDRLVATDPRGHFHQVHHHAGNPSGTYEDDSPAYWRELTDACRLQAQSSYSGTATGRQTRRIAGLPTSKNITRTSQPKWWRMCGSTSITWKRSRCSGWRSTTSPAPPPEPSRGESGERELRTRYCELPCAVRFDASRLSPVSANSRRASRRRTPDASRSSRNA